MASRIHLLPSQIERLNGDMTGSGVLQLSDIERAVNAEAHSRLPTLPICD